MKLQRLSVFCLFLLILSSAINAQEKRTMETRVADLLARMPANDNQLTDKLMIDMLSLGEEGMIRICDQVVPAGTGDDTRARFAIESLSRFLSGAKSSVNKPAWENICIDYAVKKTDSTVKDFFMKQLQIIGSEKSAEAMKGYLQNSEICGPALAVIIAAGGDKAEAILAESLKNMQVPCAAAVMNALAAKKSSLAVNEYIRFSGSTDMNTRASALNALAMSGSSQAYQVLQKAAADAGYHWEPTGATSALLNYARIIGARGDLKSADKICKLVMSKCIDKNTIQNKTAALGIYVSLHGINASSMLLKAASDHDKTYRNAAMNMSLDIQGEEMIRRWIAYFPKAIPEARPELITMFGVKSDKAAIPLVTTALTDKDQNVRTEASEAIVRLEDNKSLPALINYMMNFSGSSDQDAAKKALMTVCGSDNINQLVSVLKNGNAAAIKTTIELIAWNKGSDYFNDVFPFTASSDEVLKKSAMNALTGISEPAEIPQLLGLITRPENNAYVTVIQEAIGSALQKITDAGKRSAVILKAIDDKQRTDPSNTGDFKIKIIPVLAGTGGNEALKTVLKEFENGNSDVRDACFKTLVSWKDYSASSALYEICASANKTYEGQAFEGYVSQVKNAGIPGEEKLLLFRKIMPYALTNDRKNEVISEIGKIRTYQSLFFVSSFLDDPGTSAAAASAAMTIALPTANSRIGLYGDLVKDILIRASAKLSGPESDYNKEMINKYLGSMPTGEGFKPMFNGKDLSGWQGLVENPVARAKMKPAELAKKQAEADKKVPGNWSVKDGMIWFNGNGDNLCSVKQYGDFELLVDWKITKKGDSGIYLRGSPQVQIWDTSRVEVGAQVGSGGLYNNQVNISKPLKVADNPVGDWNTFRIIMIGEKVSVWLNGELVVDNVTLENYWDRKIPIFPVGPIELQAHGTDLAFRDIYVREISDKEFNLTPEEQSQGFVSLFNGRNLDNWVGNKKSYVAEDGMIVIKPVDDSGGNLYTEKEYEDFIFRFEFQLTAAANNGLGIRAPLTGDAAYVGMELQILDNTDPVYANLQPYQYHGSVYGVIPARREFLKPLGEWNYEEVTVTGTHIKIDLNGTTIVDGDIAGPRDNGTMDHKDHPGLKNKTGHIGFLGHGSVVKFRNIRIKDLTAK